MILFLVLTVPLILADSDSESICNTTECQNLAKRYLENMNQSMNPCDDFYEYACGSYDVVNPIPEHESKLNVLKEIALDLEQHLIAILQNSTRNNSSASMILVETYFNSCMDKESKDQLGLEPLFDLISSLGGWPLLDNSSFNSSIHWEELAGKLVLHNIHSIITPFISNSLKNTKIYMLNFFSAETTFSYSKHYDGEILEHYRQYMTSLLELLGANITGGETDGISELLGANDTASLVDDIIDFEKRLAEISSSSHSEDQSAKKNIMTYGELKNRYSFINWDLYFNEDLKQSLGEMPDSMEINLFIKDYYDQLGSVLNSTSPVTIQNYLMWHLIRTYNMYLPAKYREPFMIFENSLHGSNSARAPLWKMCLRDVRDKLSIPLANEFLHKYFTENDKSVAENMVKDLKDIMKIELEKVDWLDDSTRKTALKKLQNMHPKIGYPDYLLNETAVLRPFKDINLQPGQYLKNAISLIISKENDHFSKIYRTPEVEWSTYLLQVNALNYMYMNTILFPAGIIQFPMFVGEAPAATNYGSMGMVIGHEITHGYDTVGSQMDEDGNIRNWWDNETSTEFYNKTQCFIDQYGKEIEPLTGRKLAGKKTLTENIADNGGLRIAYQAYLRKLGRNSQKTVKLPGMEEFSPQKMFFIAYANNFCEIMKPAAMNHTLDTDTHSTGYYRANLPLQNMPEFSKVFQCAKGSVMNPEKKCKIW